jgi:hypothetical protein
MAVNLRVALLYLPESGGAAIVAPMHVNSGGICFEQDEPLRIDDWRTPSQLIPALRSALECFSPRERNLREVKKTDWPSYRASGCAWVRDFEQSYLCVNVRAVNEAEKFYEASANPHGESDLSLHATLNRNASNRELLRVLLRLQRACTTWNVSAD